MYGPCLSVRAAIGVPPAPATGPTAAAGDPVGVLLRPCLDRARALIGGRLRRITDPEDVVQSTFLQLLHASRHSTSQEAGRTLDQRAQLLLRYRVVDVARRRSVRPLLHEPVAGAGTPFDELCRHEVRAALAAALAALPNRHAAVVRMRYFDDCSFRAVAQHLRASENAVEIIHRRALRRLRAQLRRFAAGAAARPMGTVA